MASANPWQVDESHLWLRKESGWPDEVPRNMEFPKISLGDMFRESVKKFGNTRAVWFLGKFMTYHELGRHVEAFATALHRLGIKKGDVIAFLLPNSFQYVIAYYACQRLGIIASGMNPTYKPGELLHQLKATGATTLITLDSLYAAQIEPMIGQSKIQKVISTNVADLLPWPKRTLGKLLKKIPSAEVKGSLQFMDLLDTAPDVPEVKIDAIADVATYIMTGGTTGLPKAAELTHFNLVSNANQTAAWLYKVQAGMCVVGVLPLFHSFAMTGVMNISVRMGCWMMLFPRPPETKELVETVAAIGPDAGVTYPGAEILFKRLAEFPDLEKSNIMGKFALCVSGAGPLHRPVQEAFEKRTGAKLSEGYGLTETSPVVSAGNFWGKRKIGTIGFPMPGTEWHIFDSETGRKDLGVGEDKVGEICVSGPQVMKGYLNKPEENRDHFVEYQGKRYFRTGDIGYMDADGQIVIKDRKKQLIKVRGYSVFPKEVEELVGGHPLVSEVAAAGIPDPESGELIKAWVVLRDEGKGKITEKELAAWCKENMTHYKVPKLLEFRDSLPKSLVGKVMRRELQEADPLYLERKKQLGK